MPWRHVSYATYDQWKLASPDDNWEPDCPRCDDSGCPDCCETEPSTQEHDDHEDWWNALIAGHNAGASTMVNGAEQRTNPVPAVAPLPPQED